MTPEIGGALATAPLNLPDTCREWIDGKLVAAGSRFRRCERPAIAKVGGVPMCAEHGPAALARGIDAALRKAAVERLREAV